MPRYLLFLALTPLLAAQPAVTAPAGPEPTSATAPAGNPAPAPAAELILSLPEPGRFAELFHRFTTEHAALSPDGKYLAFSLRDGEQLSVVVLEVDHPETAKVRVLVVTDDQATAMFSDRQREKTPGRIRWMRWVTPSRLAVETNRIRSLDAEDGWTTNVGAMVAFDADGGNLRQLAGPKDVPELIAGGGGPFSTARTPPLQFSRGVWQPDQPVPDAGRDVASLPSLSGTVTAPRSSLGGPGPVRSRDLHAFDLDPRRPGAILLSATGAKRSTGSRSVGQFSLDTATGKITRVTENFVATNRDNLLDRQGRPRLGVPNTTSTKFPFTYEYYGATGNARPKHLGDITGLPGFSVSPENFFGERAIPLGFDEDPDILYYAANLGRDTFGLYSLNLATKQHGKITLENPGFDLVAAPVAGFGNGDALVFDRYTRKLTGVRYQATLRTTAWLRPEWQQVQADLEKTLPGSCVDLLDWDEAGRRILVSTEGPADPGGFYIYDRETRELREFVRRAPWIDARHNHASLPFGFTTTAGVHLSGLVTVPSHPKMKPIPMVILCPDQPWLRVTPDFQTEVNALAGMGFVVVQLNGRGAWGFGRKQRHSLTAGYDLVQVEDIATTVATLQQLFNVNPKRVALLGRGHGGFIALRALQSHPELFRCAIALESPTDLGDWLSKMEWNDENVFPHLTKAWLGDANRFKAAPLVRQPEAVTKPVLLLSYPGAPGDARRPLYLANRRFAEDVRRGGTVAELAELPIDYVRGLPAARAQVFDRIEAFLNEHVYDYKVKLRDLKILPDRIPAKSAPVPPLPSP
ncbi:MAG TPA: prolyl oligopeptidase family serine peptidase [Lacunisphaera sp.]|nr:prolyl oligopeptidase family serine peptidase [Lacunisphaera sp.]